MAVLPTGIGPVTGGYQIERSLRFNSADSAYLNRTFGTSVDRKKSTISFWVKRSTLTSAQVLFVGGVGTSDFTQISFNGSDQLRFYSFLGGATNGQLDTVAVFRDVSAWYNICVSCDFANATAADRVKIYVNNVLQTVTTTTTVTNANHGINGAIEHRIGRGFEASPFYLNGYITECYFVDAQVLTPSSFGETDSATGVWKPKAYSGTYGTNGFYLKFADNSGTTSTTLGKDSSGNGNNWTPNNFSVTAGVNNDSMVDSPTAYGTDTGVGGEVRGNYCTLNPLAPPVWAGTNYALSNGNLAVTFGYQTAPSTFSVSSGKWYWEVNCTTNNGSGSNNTRIGIVPNPYGTGTPGDMTGSYAYTATGQKGASNVYTTYGASFTDGDIIGVALDLDNGTIAFYKNGSSQGTAYTGISGSFYAMSGSGSSSGTVQSYNFGQRAFAYTAPSGFKALCTQNLPTPTIGATSTTQAGKYFNVKTYTGTGATQSITGIGFQPDLIWGKQRNGTSSHVLTDAVRGTNSQLSSNLTNAQDTQTDVVTAFNSDGFTVGASGGFNMNQNGSTIVAWCWDANGAGSSNTAGTITSTVSANTTSGFSIVTWTGNGTNGSTIGHGLGIKPALMIFKSRNNAGSAADWMVYHASLGATKNLRLQSTAAESVQTAVFNDTEPTSTVFTVGTNNNINASGGTMLTYCFAPVAGYSAFGSYTGNGSTDGPFVHLGFRPKFFMTKRTNGAGDNWHIHDTTRSTYNIAYADLRPNTNDAENTSAYPMDILSNGIKWRQGGSDGNESGATYIYAAFAENPFKYSLAR